MCLGAPYTQRKLAEEAETRGEESRHLLSPQHPGPNLASRCGCDAASLQGFVAMPDGWVLGSGFGVINWTLFFSV